MVFRAFIPPALDVKETILRRQRFGAMVTVDTRKVTIGAKRKVIPRGAIILFITFFFGHSINFYFL